MAAKKKLPPFMGKESKAEEKAEMKKGFGKKAPPFGKGKKKC